MPEHEIKDLKNIIEKNHDENRKNIGTLFKKVDELKESVLKLPCGVHQERMKWFEQRLTLMGWVIGIVVICGIVLGLWIKSV